MPGDGRSETAVAFLFCAARLSSGGQGQAPDDFAV